MKSFDGKEITRPLILIVDDTPLNIQVLAEALHNDYRVKVANGASMAFDIIEKFGPPDLVLLDVMMPDMDGYEVCRRLKRSAITVNVPVIFVTAKTDTLDEEYGLKLGAVDYIVKPFQIPVVTARIRNHINLKIKSDLLESQAMIDGLTNVPNRRRFNEALELESKRASRSGRPLSLIMVDIDFFKKYNDHYGHGSGDICLKRVAECLQSCLERPSDTITRYGGEEFAAILPDTDPDGARMIAERFRENIEAMKIPHEKSEVSGFVTVSIGLSTLCVDKDTDPQIIINHADKQLYLAKEKGRNRVLYDTNCGE